MDENDKELKICSIVVLYEPKIEDFLHVCDYYDKVDIAYVIDNSKENNLELVMQSIRKTGADKGKVEYYHFPENIGLCKAFNFGVSEAQKKGCNWVLLMDSDSSFINDIIDVYISELKKLEDDKVAVLSPVHVYDRKKTKEYSGIKDVKWAMTSGCLYNVKAFNSIGGFMEKLFVECLDIDFCYRAREKGYRIVECGDAYLKHFPAETREFRLFGKMILKYGYASPNRYRMQARSIIWLIHRYKKLEDVIRYLSKWGKTILFFDKKADYISCLKKGTQEGRALVKEMKRIK